MSKELAAVRRAAKRAASASAELETAIRAARTAGASLREIAREAGMSPEWIRRITKENP